MGHLKVSGTEAPSVLVCPLINLSIQSILCAVTSLLPKIVTSTYLAVRKARNSLFYMFFILHVSSCKSRGSNIGKGENGY